MAAAATHKAAASTAAAHAPTAAAAATTTVCTAATTAAKCTATTTTAVGTAAATTAKCTATAATAKSTCSATGITTRPATGISSASCISSAARIGSASAVSSTAAVGIPAPAVTVAATTVAAASPAVPRANADEEAAVKPLRTVIAVGSAGIRVIRVVAPLAYRGTVIHRRGNHRGADSNSLIGAYCSSLIVVLRICRNRERQSQNHRYQNQSHTPHDVLHVLPRPALPGLGTRSLTPFSAPAGLWVSRPNRLLIIRTTFQRLSCG